MRHPRAQQRRLSPMRILILCNLVFAASIYGLVQWRFSETDSRAVRLGGGGQVHLVTRNRSLQMQIITSLTGYCELIRCWGQLGCICTHLLPT